MLEVKITNCSEMFDLRGLKYGACRKLLDYFIGVVNLLSIMGGICVLDTSLTVIQNFGEITT
jgi:hypothetical protein